MDEVLCTVSAGARSWLCAKNADRPPNVLLLAEIHWPDGEIRGWMGEVVEGSPHLLEKFGGLRFKIDDFDVFASTSEPDRSRVSLSGAVGHVYENTMYFGFSEEELPVVHQHMFRAERSDGTQI